MVMSAFFKAALRSIKQNTAKLISLSFIIFLGIAFVSGLGTLAPTIEDSFAQQLQEHNVADIIVKSTSENGFSKEEIESFRAHPAVSMAESSTVIDLFLFQKYTRIYILPDTPAQISTLTIEGAYPSADNEILAERASDSTEEHFIGEEISLYGYTAKIVGIASNPLIFERTGEPCLTNTEATLQQIFYVPKALLPVDMPITDIHLRLPLADRDLFSSEYHQAVSQNIAQLKQDIGSDYAYLTLNENKSFAMLRSYCDKVSIIALIFPVFFIAVAALVVLTSMTRMVEEERSTIGCCKSLGIGDGKIIFKYTFIAAFCCIVSSALAMAVGFFLLPRVIYPAFDILFFLPQMSALIAPMEAILSFLCMFIVVCSVTGYVTAKELRAQPALLLIPKAPKAGKTIFLEKIPLLWNRLSFRFKSCFRNIFRNKKHFFMTVISVAGSTALVFAGFALLDVSESMTEGIYAGLKDSLIPIAILVIAFALLLCVFVIYNLTNMNIAERKREIATLMVLGYHQREVAGYIYREILIMAIIGIVFGIALGCILIHFVFTYLEFGALASVKWYSYLASGALVVSFIAIVDLLLLPKLRKLDMTASLKSVD